MTPSLVHRVVARCPGLRMYVSSMGDMLDPQEWGAVLSAPGADGVAVYRYLLWRVIDPSLPILVVLMLNPSRATHEQGDRTVDGLMRRATMLGYGTVLVVNCFAYRATDPVDMRKAADPVGPANDIVLETVLGEEVDLLCAWGVNAAHMDRERTVRCAISSGRARPHVLRLCANGAPEHPLYIPSALGLTPWSVRPDGIGADATP